MLALGRGRGFHLRLDPVLARPGGAVHMQEVLAARSDICFCMHTFHPDGRPQRPFGCELLARRLCMPPVLRVLQPQNPQTLAPPATPAGPLRLLRPAGRAILCVGPGPKPLR